MDAGVLLLGIRVFAAGSNKLDGPGNDQGILMVMVMAMMDQEQ